MKKIAFQWLTIDGSQNAVASCGVTGIGIVLMRNEVKEITCRIGKQIADNLAEDLNILWIMQHGGKLSREQAIAFFPEFKVDIELFWKKN